MGISGRPTVGDSLNNPWNTLTENFGGMTYTWPPMIGAPSSMTETTRGVARASSSAR